MGARTYYIIDYRLENFRKAFTSLAARAVKLGCVPPTCSEGATSKRVFEIFESWAGRAVKICDEVHDVTEVTITGEPPCLKGWTFLGTIDLSAPGGAPILRSAVLGQEMAERYRTARGTCEHCDTDRDRSEVFVVRHEDGRELQVGRQCVRDFLGGINPDDLAALASTLKDLSGFEDDNFDGSDGFGGRGFEPQLAPLDYLRWVAFIVRRFGWRSRKQDCDGGATADFAWNAIGQARHDAKQGKPVTAANRPNAEDETLATVALAWAAGLSTAGHRLTDFEHNLTSMAKGSFVRQKDIGFVAAIVSSYLAMLAARAAVKNEYVGVVGAALRGVKVTVVAVHDLGEKRYGCSRKAVMRDAEGHELLWMTTATTPTVGQVYLVDGKVKKHDEYRGVKQTYLTNVSFVPEGYTGPTKAQQRAAARALETVSLALYQAISWLRFDPWDWTPHEETEQRRKAAFKAGDMAALEALRLDMLGMVDTTKMYPSATPEQIDNARKEIRAVLDAAAPKPAKTPRAPRAKRSAVAPAGAVS